MSKLRHVVLLTCAWLATSGHAQELGKDAGDLSTLEE